MAHEILARIFGMTRRATVRVEPAGEFVKICINGQFGDFSGTMQRETARLLAADLLVASDAKN